jgi:hypothetical protein
MISSKKFITCLSFSIQLFTKLKINFDYERRFIKFVKIYFHKYSKKNIP